MIVHDHTETPSAITPKPASTIAEMRTQDLEVMRLVLQAGKSVPAHKVQGDITIQCIEGALSVGSDGQDHLLRAGNLLYLKGSALHSVLALEDSSAIVTVALKK